MKATKSKLNVKLLRRIKRHILAEPKRFLMTCTVLKARSQAEWKHELDMKSADDASKVRPPCGTAACIAGWAGLFTNCRYQGYSLLNHAARVLGVEQTPSWAGHTLFSSCAWPHPFASRYIQAKSPARRAKIAAERIEHLITTGE